MRCCVPVPVPELEPDAVAGLEEVDGSDSLSDLAGVGEALGAAVTNEGAEVAPGVGFNAALYDKVMVDES